MPEKRDGDGPEGQEVVPAKRQRTDLVAVPSGGDGDKGKQLAVTKDGVKRTSSLLAPIMLLTGHAAGVFTMKFSPDGEVIASGSQDKEIFLWRIEGECDNYMVLKGHKNVVLELHWAADGHSIVSASPDQTVRAWDVETGKQIKKMAEHSSFVNSCCPAPRGPPLIVSGSDDGTAKLWDMRVRGCIQTFPDKYQVTSVAFSYNGDKVYSGGIDNQVKVWDLRRSGGTSAAASGGGASGGDEDAAEGSAGGGGGSKGAEPVMRLLGHTDTITGMRVSPDGAYLLTNAMDCTLRIWDLRPYAPQNRCVKIFTGHQHSVEKNLLKCDWSPDGSRVTAGSADRMVYVWDTTMRRILYKLPGHKGSVNEAVFHPSQPIIGSCSSDKQIYLGELDPSLK
ncbi:hypothetical protein CLOM_g18720 [Closterium sp. NIES-68]|nr:hypothetical protein CLOM_g18720 [Closterium sp. NIES-68]GJP74741.1 hypothetical protein CLOP_g5282 [Closterium sp. NIES-67]